MAREDLHFRLRIPELLKARISEAAELNKRSMTAEMIARLEDSFMPLFTDDPNPFEEYAKTAAKMAATEAATQAMDAVFSALKALEGMNNSDRARILSDAVSGAHSARIPESDDPEGAN